MQLLITGATGIIGKNLLKQLTQKHPEIQIHILSRKTNLNIQKNINIIKGDLHDQATLNLATQNIDTILHLAGVTHSHDSNLYFKVNTEGTKNLLSAATKNNVKKFIYISSRTACKNGGAYAQSKLLAENAVKEFKNNWIILRIAEVYEENTEDMIFKISQIIKKYHIAPIVGNGKYKLAPIHVEDASQAIINSINNHEIYHKTYLLAGQNSISYIDIINQIIKNDKKKVIKIYIPIFLLKITVLFLSFFKFDIISKDQIPRLLCHKSTNIENSKNDLDFNPREFSIKSIKKT